MSNIDLSRLCAPFFPNEIEWRIGATNGDKTKGIALPYITNRAVQKRLDDVCGADNWWNEFEDCSTGTMCGITICIDDKKIVTKWDGADKTTIEPTKGGISNAMKRAAAQWGIGRYLYSLPTYWVGIKKRGNGYVFADNLPTLPEWALPENCEKNDGYAENDYSNTGDTSLGDFLNNEMKNDNSPITAIEAKTLSTILKKREEEGLLKVDAVLRYFKVKSVSEITKPQYAECLRVLQQKEERAEKEKAEKTKPKK